MSPEMATRVRRAMIVAFTARLAPGAVLLAVVLWRYVSRPDQLEQNWLMMTGAVVVATAVHQVVNRHRVASWPPTNAFSTLFVGFIVGAMTAEHVDVVQELLTEQSTRNPVCAGAGAALGALLGWWLGKYAVRATLAPFTPDLADTPFEIPFRIRHSTKQIMITTIRLTVEASFARKQGWTADTHSLVDIDRKPTTQTLIDGDSVKAAFPKAVRHTPGPALRFVDEGKTWLVPTDQADQAAEILTRRVAAARASIQ